MTSVCPRWVRARRSHRDLFLLIVLLVTNGPFESASCASESADSATPSQLVSACEAKSWDVAGNWITEDQATYHQPDGMTALHWASFHGNAELVAKILRVVPTPDLENQYGITPLALACQNGDSQSALLLLEAGADPNRLTPGKVSCLMLASRTGSVSTIEQLLANGADVNSQSNGSQTALMWAAAAGHADAIDALVDAGADLQHRVEAGFTAIMFAARQGQTTATLRLIEHGCDVNDVMQNKKTGGRKPRKKMSALLLAVESAHYELAIELVKAGADPNDERSGYAPLHALSWVRRPQKGDNPEGDPPPRGSGTMSSLQFVREMVALGADVNMKLRRGTAGKGRLNPRGATPFLLASQTVDLPFMKVLLELGADPTINNHDDCSALLAAAGVGAHFVGEHEGSVAEVEKAVRFLVEQGLDINHVDKKGETAMHGATYRSYPETVKLVAQLGALPENWDHKNKYGWTPLTIAKGYRPGSFKPAPAVIEAVKQELGDRKELEQDAPPRSDDYGDGDAYDSKENKGKPTP